MAQRLSKRRLVSIAQRVRAELESFRDVKTSDPYHWRSPKDLGGFCMYGAIMVWQALRKLGREPKIVAGSGHWFTHCDGYLIDVTASQFGKADIVVERLPIDRHPHDTFWEPVRASRSIKGHGETFIRYRNYIEEARRAKRKGASK